MRLPRAIAHSTVLGVFPAVLFHADFFQLNLFNADFFQLNLFPAGLFSAMSFPRENQIKPSKPKLKPSLTFLT